MQKTASDTAADFRCESPQAASCATALAAIIFLFLVAAELEADAPTLCPTRENHMPTPDNQYLHTDENGVTRCWWGASDQDYRHYHDEEWGHPVNDDIRLFEKICLEGFQAGLSWLTILRKREHFRQAFCGFDYVSIADFGDDDVNRLLQNPGIVRHRGKIMATINNARRAKDLAVEYGSLANYIWQWEPAVPEPQLDRITNDNPIPSITKTSQALSKDLKKRGWKFVGPTTVYAFMQAMGLVNDHLPGCFCRPRVAEMRQKFAKP